MQETGVHNGAYGADKFGLKNLKGVNWNFGGPCPTSVYADGLTRAPGELTGGNLRGLPRRCRRTRNVTFRRIDGRARYNPYERNNRHSFPESAPTGGLNPLKRPI